MKKFLNIFLTFFLICSGFISHAQFIQDSLYSNSFEPRKNNIIKTNPLTIIQGSIPFTAEYRLILEHMLGNKSSIQIGGSYLGKSPLQVYNEANSTDPVRLIVKGYRFQAEFRYYISGFINDKTAPEGFYVAPSFSLSHAKFTNRYYNTYNEYISFDYTNYCLKAGYQLMDNTLTLDFFTGIGYRNNILVDKINSPAQANKIKDFEVYHGPLKLLLGFNMGYAF
jgi:hypothetical protein